MGTVDPLKSAARIMRACYDRDVGPCVERLGGKKVVMNAVTVLMVCEMLEDAYRGRGKRKRHAV